MKKFVVRFLSLVMAALMVLGCAAFAEEDYSGKVTSACTPARASKRRGAQWAMPTLPSTPALKLLST